MRSPLDRFLSPAARVLFFAAFAATTISAFQQRGHVAFGTRTIHQHSVPHPVLLSAAKKGFGASSSDGKKKEKSEGQLEREKASSRYDEIAEQGGQEYSIFVRQFGSEDSSWLPCGAIAVPRAAQVSDAIFSNEEALKKAIVRTYPRLTGQEDEFEFGYNLKIYPDDPVEVAMKGGPRAPGLSIGNWISTLLSPVDASQQQTKPSE